MISLKKIIFLIFTLGMVIFCNKVSAFDYYTYTWENMYIEVERGTSIYDYLDKPKATLYKNGELIDEEIVYLQGDAFSSISEINTSVVGTYFLNYYAISRHIEEMSTVIFEVVEVDREKPEITQISEIILNVNDEFNLDDFFVFSDNVTERKNLEINYNSNLDLNKNGEYDLTIYCVDEFGNMATLISKIVVVDNDSPVITLIKDIVIEYGKDLDILEYVTATDNMDGNITSSLIYDEVDTYILGHQYIKLSVLDSSGNKTTISVLVNVIDSTAPSFSLKLSRMNLTIQDVMEVSNIYWKENILSYEDNCSKLTQNNIYIDDSELLPLVGGYYVYYKVIDSSGNESSQKLYVNVICDSTPVLSVSDIHINVGSGVDYYKYIKAEDKYDGDISDNIEIEDSNLNINKKGIYVVSLKVKNSNNIYTYDTVTIYVEQSSVKIYIYALLVISGVSIIGYFLYKKFYKKTKMGI